MFKKLRNKFLILNMLITSLVMIAAFATIYFITYRNIQSQILDHLKAQTKTQTEMQVSAEGTDLPEVTEKEGGMTIAQQIPMDGPQSFIIEVDPEGKILMINSFIDMPKEAYDKATETAWSNKESNATLALADKQWRYAVAQVIKQVIDVNGHQYFALENKYKIIFLDVTEYNQRLSDLFTTLLFVGLLMFFAILIISLYFANQAIKPIARAWERQKIFVADASHELKTPISIINANYDALLANQDETIKSQLKWLGYIKIGTDRMTKLINGLLSLAKVEDENYEIVKMPYNLSNVILDVMQAMEAVVDERGIKLTYSIESDIIVKGDEESVKQVVTILFDNAIKYSNENGQVDISLYKSKRQVIFSITNSGKGIAKQDLPKVFDRFFRADPSRTQDSGSYGLGLSIAKAMMDRLGGEIHATSVEDGSTTFTFIFGL